MDYSENYDPVVARYARQRLDQAWHQWQAFRDPPAIVRLEHRIEDGEAWLEEHGPDDAKYESAAKLLAGLRRKLIAARQEPREQRRAATWRRLEAAFVEAEADYLSLVGSPRRAAPATAALDG